MWVGKSPSNALTSMGDGRYPSCPSPSWTAMPSKGRTTSGEEIVAQARAGAPDAAHIVNCAPGLGRSGVVTIAPNPRLDVRGAPAKAGCAFAQAIGIAYGTPVGGPREALWRMARKLGRRLQAGHRFWRPVAGLHHTRRA